jgi:hypothetical protein
MTRSNNICSHANEIWTSLPGPRISAIEGKADIGATLPDIRYWHKADISLLNPNVRFWG